MSNLVEFGRMFLSYGLLMVVIVAVMAVAIFIGINWAKKKDAEAKPVEESADVVSKNPVDAKNVSTEENADGSAIG